MEFCSFGWHFVMFLNLVVKRILSKTLSRSTDQWVSQILDRGQSQASRLSTRINGGSD
jgi:hypothetical protein